MYGPALTEGVGSVLTHVCESASSCRDTDTLLRISACPCNYSCSLGMYLRARNCEL